MKKILEQLSSLSRTRFFYGIWNSRHFLCRYVAGLKIPKKSFPWKLFYYLFPSRLDRCSSISHELSSSPQPNRIRKHTCKRNINLYIFKILKWNQNRNPYLIEENIWRFNWGSQKKEIKRLLGSRTFFLKGESGIFNLSKPPFRDLLKVIIQNQVW